MRGGFLGPLIRLVIFAVVTVLATGALGLTIANSGTSGDKNFSAIFTDASLLNPGDDVRIAGVRVGTVQSVQVHDHNLYFSPGNPNPIGIAAGRGDLVADPRFADLQNRNFRLSPRSPARDAGAKVPEYATDLDGYPVPKGGGWTWGRTSTEWGAGRQAIRD